MIGCNARMDGFQGAVLSVKLKHLPTGHKLAGKMQKNITSYLMDLMT